MQDSLSKEHYIIKKIRRKVNFSLFSFILIFFVPYLNTKYRPFDTILNTQIRDFMFLPIGFRDTVISRLPVFLVLLLVVFIYIIVILLKISKADITDERVVEDLKKTHSRFDLIAFMVHVMAIYVIINTFFFSFASVDGSSMSPTFAHGDDVIMSHVFSRYERGDIVVIEVGNSTLSETFYVKRLIGVPGDEIVIEDGQVTLNGTLLDEPYLALGTRTECADNLDRCVFELGEDEYFLLGDNRERSEDSRHIGVVSLERIYGNVRFRIRPVRSFGRVS